MTAGATPSRITSTQIQFVSGTQQPSMGCLPLDTLLLLPSCSMEEAFMDVLSQPAQSLQILTLAMATQVLCQFTPVAQFPLQLPLQFITITRLTMLPSQLDALAQLHHWRPARLCIPLLAELVFQTSLYREAGLSTTRTVLVSEWVVVAHITR